MTKNKLSDISREKTVLIGSSDQIVVGTKEYTFS